MTRLYCLHLTAKRHLIIFKYDEFADILEIFAILGDYFFCGLPHLVEMLQYDYIHFLAVLLN